MRRDTVLVLGAGASFGARPASPRPPRGDELAAYLLAWLEENDPRSPDAQRRAAVEYDEAAPDSGLWDEYAVLRPILEKARDSGSPFGFEHEMSRLAEGSKVGLLSALNRVIASAFLGGRECAFEEGPDLYDRLFRALGARLRAIVTPNYDLLAEEALSRLGEANYFAGTREAPAGVAIYKIHGSVNFVHVPGGGRGATLETARANTKDLRLTEQAPFPSAFNDHGLYPIAGSRRNKLLHYNTGEYEPIMVTYGPFKPAVFGRAYLDAIREACAAALRGGPPARVIAAGIRPPSEADGGVEDDPTWMGLCGLLAELPSRKFYWSRVVSERDAMGKFGFEGCDGWLADLVLNVENENGGSQ